MCVSTFFADLHFESCKVLLFSFSGGLLERLEDFRFVVSVVSVAADHARIFVFCVSHWWFSVVCCAVFCLLQSQGYRIFVPSRLLHGLPAAAHLRSWSCELEVRDRTILMTALVWT